jgi:hypothetical protein
MLVSVCSNGSTLPGLDLGPGKPYAIGIVVIPEVCGSSVAVLSASRTYGRSEPASPAK